MTTRQLLPHGLADMAPGPELTATLAGLDPSRLAGVDTVTAMRAAFRDRNAADALLLRLVWEAGRADEPDGLSRRELIDEFSADEARGPLGCSRTSALMMVTLADDLIVRLPRVFAAMGAGDIGRDKGAVFSEWTADVADDLAERVCRIVLPEAPRLTIRELQRRILQVVLASDADWADRRRRRAQRRARVVGSRTDAGTASLGGYDLPLERVVPCAARIESIAARARAAGVGWRLDALQAEAYLLLLEGPDEPGAEMDDDAVVARLVACHAGTTEPPDYADPGPGDPGPDDPDPGDPGPGDPEPGDPGPGDPDPGDPGPGDPGPHGGPGPGEGPEDVSPDGHRSGGHRDGDIAAASLDTDEPEPEPESEPEQSEDEPEGHRPGRPRSGAIELRVRLSTVLGLDELPGEIAGWGPVLPTPLRAMVLARPRAHWRLVVTDDQGRLLHVDVVRRRPRGARQRGAPAPSRTIVELQAPATLLDALDPDDHPGWAPLLAELRHRWGTARAEHGGGDDQALVPRGDGRLRRFARAALARWCRVRDRSCIGPCCGRPAVATDLDHTVDWLLGGPTDPDNLGSACRHEHRLKHRGGWTLAQLSPGEFRWTTRAGATWDVPARPVLAALPAALPTVDGRPRPVPDPVPPPDPPGARSRIWPDDPRPSPAPPPPPRPGFSRYDGPPPF